MPSAEEIPKTTMDEQVPYMLEAGLGLLSGSAVDYAKKVLNVRVGMIIDTIWMTKTRSGEMKQRTLKAKVVSALTALNSFDDDDTGRIGHFQSHLVRYSSNNSVKKLSSKTSEVVFVNKDRLFDYGTGYCVQWSVASPPVKATPSVKPAVASQALTIQVPVTPTRKVATRGGPSPAYDPASPAYDPSSPAYQSPRATTTTTAPRTPKEEHGSPAYNPSSPAYQPAAAKEDAATDAAVVEKLSWKYAIREMKEVVPAPKRAKRQSSDVVDLTDDVAPPAKKQLFSDGAAAAPKPIGPDADIVGYVPLKDKLAQLRAQGAVDYSDVVEPTPPAMLARKSAVMTIPETPSEVVDLTAATPVPETAASDATVAQQYDTKPPVSRGMFREKLDRSMYNDETTQVC